jgi:predicted nucleic acid-binding protein
LTLEAVESDASIFIDAPIFIYHFSGASSECRRLLERCERGDLRGVTSVAVLAEVAHRVMTIEAVTKGLISPGNVVRKLREKPEIVSSLRAYQERVEQIPLMFIEVVPLDVGLFLRSAELRKRFGLLVNDSLAAASALELKVDAMASADPDFGRVPGLTLYRPSDVQDIAAITSA